MRDKAITIVVIIAIILGITVAILGVMAIFQLSNPQEYKVVSVQIQTELQSTSNGDGQVSEVKTKYLYFCTLENEEIIVFENEDSLFNGKFDSSTLLAQLKSYEKSGESFTIRTRGWRIPLFSMYQNIIEIVKEK